MRESRDRKIQKDDREKIREGARTLWAVHREWPLADVVAKVNIGYARSTVEDWIRDLSPNRGRRGRRPTRKSRSTP